MTEKRDSAGRKLYEVVMDEEILMRLIIDYLSSMRDESDARIVLNCINTLMKMGIPYEEVYDAIFEVTQSESDERIDDLISEATGESPDA